jgi:hypothetical protein
MNIASKWTQSEDRPGSTCEWKSTERASLTRDLTLHHSTQLRTAIVQPRVGTARGDALVTGLSGVRAGSVRTRAWVAPRVVLVEEMTHTGLRTCVCAIELRGHRAS